MTDGTSTEARLLRIEERLKDIENRLASNDPLDRRAASGWQTHAASDPIDPEPKQGSWPFGLKNWSSEDWLQRLGIALLLFGLAFLFKYSIDQGWLTPVVRIGTGIFLGCGLIVFGLRMIEARFTLARTLAGGGIACLYISIFAAFQLYHLISFELAFAGMLLITLIAFALSLKRLGAPIAFIASIGGYATPFVLYTGNENLAGLLIYGGLISLIGCLVYLYRPWRSLLIVTVIGGWAILVAGYSSADFRSDNMNRDAALTLQYGVIWFWALYALVPLLSLRIRDKLDQAVFGLVISTPTLGMAFTEHLWGFPSIQWVGIWMGIAAIYAGIAFSLHRKSEALAWSHGLAAATLFTVGLWHLLSRDVLLLAIALEALALLDLARRFKADVPERIGHLLMAAVLYVLIMQLIEDAALTPPIINTKALTELAVIGICMLVAWRYSESGRSAYALVGHLTLLAWFYRELHPLANGQVFISVAWSVYGAGLLIAAFRLGHAGLRKLAMATLLLVVIKLFIVDLSRIAAIWRVLISLGLGGMFLLLSYYLPGMWRGKKEELKTTEPQMTKHVRNKI